jgi:hypothetical protein
MFHFIVIGKTLPDIKESVFDDFVLATTVDAIRNTEHIVEPNDWWKHGSPVSLFVFPRSVRIEELRCWLLEL